jgi:hypothetical protein
MLHGGVSMRWWVVAAAALMANGCVYVTKAEFDSYWDEDGDGWPLGEDCDPLADTVFPYAADVRGDGCDSDCGEESDQDGDDWPDDSDCDPEDPTIFPCSDAEENGDGVDSDCDGADSARDDTCPTADPDFPDVTEVVCGGGGGEQ